MENVKKKKCTNVFRNWRQFMQNCVWFRMRGTNTTFKTMPNYYEIRYEHYSPEGHLQFLRSHTNFWGATWYWNRPIYQHSLWLGHKSTTWRKWLIFIRCVWVHYFIWRIHSQRTQKNWLLFSVIDLVNIGNQKLEILSDQRCLYHVRVAGTFVP